MPAILSINTTDHADTGVSRPPWPAAIAALIAAATDGKALVDDHCAKKGGAELTRE